MEQFRIPEMREVRVSERQEANENCKDEGKLYEVERVIKKGIDFNGKIYYKIKWVDFPEEKSTWEPIENLSGITELIHLYEMELKKKHKKYMTTPKKVNFAKYYKKKLYVNVSWKQPKEKGENANILLPDTMVAYEEMREKHPKLLIDFYERRMKYGKEDIEVKSDSTVVIKSN